MLIWSFCCVEVVLVEGDFTGLSLLIFLKSHIRRVVLGGSLCGEAF